MIVFGRDFIKKGMDLQQRIPSGSRRLLFGCTILSLALFGGMEAGAAVPDCESILPGLKVPAKLKTRGKPKRGTLGERGQGRHAVCGRPSRTRSVR